MNIFFWYPFIIILGTHEVRLCTVSETEKNSKVAVFKLDPDDPTRTKEVLADFPSFGSYPCHISQVEPERTEIYSDQEDWYIAVCNYGQDKGGSGVSIYGIDFQDKVWVPGRFPFKGDGSGKDKNRQQGPHAHSSVGNAGFNGEMFVADLGSDTIVQYDLGLCEISKRGSLALPSGSGPRSLSFSNQKDRLGVVSLEMAGSILLVRTGLKSTRRAWESDSDDDEIDLETCGHPVSILPADWPKDDDDDDDDDGKAMAKFNNGKWASDVVWSKNGKYVFAAARLHNSIAIFEVLRPAAEEKGKEELPKLSFVRRVETRGKTPRCLTVSPGGEFLLICHQHSHDVTCFKIDETNGSLDFVDKIDVPLASCVKLIENKCGCGRLYFGNKSSDKPRAKKPKV